MHRILTPTFDRRRFQLWLKSLSSPGAKRDNDAVLGGPRRPARRRYAHIMPYSRAAPRASLVPAVRTKPAAGPGACRSRCPERQDRPRLTWRSGAHLRAGGDPSVPSSAVYLPTLAYVKGGNSRRSSRRHPRTPVADWTTRSPMARVERHRESTVSGDERVAGRST